MDLNKKTTQRIMLLIAFAVLLFWGLYNISAIGNVLSGLLSLLAPLLIGVCIAFVLNLMMAGLERLWGADQMEQSLERQAEAACLPDADHGAVSGHYFRHLLHPHPPAGGGGRRHGGQHPHLCGPDSGVVGEPQ